MMKFSKYSPYPTVDIPLRQWPNRQITKAPIWCSVDLRDGNQALETPMTLEQKLDFFKYLVKIGFKEIEIGFPAASDTEFQFARRLIEDNLIPDDVVVQVLTQAREHIIRRTFEALAGVKKAVVHFYNSTSTLQRDVVFKMSKAEIMEVAVSGAKLVNELANQYGRDHFIFQYSPESFTGTELDYAVEVSNAVIDVFQPTSEQKLILNLPATVEMSTPNIYADQIEYMCTHINNRENVIISIHTHNDRGTAVAASELGMLAGADRVEGTLFGNGERTGNADIVALALNLFSQGIDPKLDFSDIDQAIAIYENTTNLPVHQRHPYAGTLVFTAFSGSHQDAINKGMSRMTADTEKWAVPYLPIDPKDLGRSYDPIIRINSQSGKGGVAYILQQHYEIQLPKKMQMDFGPIVTAVSDSGSKELLKEEIYHLFTNEYVNISVPFELIDYTEKVTTADTTIAATIKYVDQEKVLNGAGNGLVDAFCKTLTSEYAIQFEIKNYSQHSLENGSESRAITYIEIGFNGKSYFGAGIDSSISKSSLLGVLSAVNRMVNANSDIISVESKEPALV